MNLRKDSMNEHKESLYSSALVCASAAPARSGRRLLSGMAAEGAAGGRRRPECSAEKLAAAGVASGRCGARSPERGVQMPSGADFAAENCASARFTRKMGRPCGKSKKNLTHALPVNKNRLPLHAISVSPKGWRVSRHDGDAAPQSGRCRKGRLRTYILRLSNFATLFNYQEDVGDVTSASGIFSRCSDRLPELLLRLRRRCVEGILTTWADCVVLSLVRAMRRPDNRVGRE